MAGIELINQAIAYLKLIGILIVGAGLLLLGLGFYFLKIRKVKSIESEIDYNSFDRKDTLEYVKFDDIKGMVIDRERTRFISGIKCTGFDYADAEEDEKLQAMRGYLGFLNLIDQGSIQYWQTAMNVDLDELLLQYREELEKAQEKRFLLTLDYEAVKEESKKYLEKEVKYNLYYGKLRQMQRELVSSGCQCSQLQAQIAYMEEISGEKADPQQEQCYVFDWTYNKIDFTTELSEDEIFETARKKLRSMAESYMSALRSAGVKCSQLTDEELLSYLRFHMHPVSAELYKTEDILKSGFDSLTVSSKSFEKKEQEVNAAMVNEVLKQLEEGNS